ncbi:hypothetical protein ACFLU5_05680 [Bacteroidota bacterium]
MKTFYHLLKSISNYKNPLRIILIFFWVLLLTINSYATTPFFIAGWPKAVNLTATSVDLEVQIDVAGTYYYVLVADAATPPTNLEVKAGTGSGGSGEIQAGSSAISATTVTTSYLTSLSEATPYDLYVVAEDDEAVPNLQATPTLVEFTTFTSIGITSAVATAKNTIEITFDENIDFVSDGAGFLSKTSATGLDLTHPSTTAAESGAVVTITLDASDEVGTDYTASDLAINASAVKVAGGTSPGEDNEPLSNESITDGAKPLIESATAIKVAGTTKIRLIYSENVTPTYTNTDDWRLDRATNINSTGIEHTPPSTTIDIVIAVPTTGYSESELDLRIATDENDKIEDAALNKAIELDNYLVLDGQAPEVAETTPFSWNVNGTAGDYELAVGDKFDLDFSETLENSAGEVVTVIKNAAATAFSKVAGDFTVTPATTDDFSFRVEFTDATSGSGAINLTGSGTTITVSSGSVSDVNSNASSADITFLVEDPDETPPTFSSATATGPKTVIVAFDEELSSADVNDFQIGDGGTYVLFSASYSNNEVTLTTTGASPDFPTDYSASGGGGLDILIGAVADTAGNSIASDITDQIISDGQGPEIAGTTPFSWNVNGTAGDYELAVGDKFDLDFSETLENSGGEVVTVIKDAAATAFSKVAGDFTVAPATTDDFSFRVEFTDVTSGSGAINLTGSGTIITISAGDVSDVNTNVSAADITFLVEDPDETPPGFISAKFTGPTTVEVTFDELLLSGSADGTKFRLDDTIVDPPGSAVVDSDPTKVILTLGSAVPPNETSTNLDILVGAVADTAGNYIDANINNKTVNDGQPPLADGALPFDWKTNPSNDDYTLALDDEFYLKFNEPMENGSDETLDAIAAAAEAIFGAGNITVTPSGGDPQTYTVKYTNATPFDLTGSGKTITLSLGSVSDANGNASTADIKFLVEDPDEVSPTFSEAIATGPTTVEVVFDEQLQSGVDGDLFSIDGVVIGAGNAALDGDPTKVILTLASAVGTGFNSTDLDITAGAVLDTAGNSFAGIGNQTVKDGQVPEILSATAIGSTTIQLQYSEPVAVTYNHNLTTEWNATGTTITNAVVNVTYDSLVDLTVDAILTSYAGTFTTVFDGNDYIEDQATVPNPAADANIVIDDGQVPELLSATAISSTKIQLQYSEPVTVGYSHTGTEWVVSGTTVTGAAVNATYDSLVDLTVSTIHTGYAGTFTTTFDGDDYIRDQATSPLTAADASGYVIDDGQIPVILSASATGSTTIQLQYSEPVAVTYNNDLTTEWNATGTTVTNAVVNVTYDSLVDLTVATILTSYAGTFTTVFDGNDYIEDQATAPNPAANANIAIDDGQVPELLSATAISSTKIQLQYSEPVTVGYSHTGTEWVVSGTTVTGAAVNATYDSLVDLTVSTINTTGYTGTFTTTFDGDDYIRDQAAPPLTAPDASGFVIDDGQVPVILSASATGSTTIQLQYSEPVSVTFNNDLTTEWTVTGGVTVNNAVVNGTYDSLVDLTLGSAILTDYTGTFTTIFDGNDYIEDQAAAPNAAANANITIDDLQEPNNKPPYPQVVNIGTLTADLEIQIDEDGKYYYVLLSNGTLTDHTWIKLGKDVDGTDAILSGNATILKDEIKQINLTGLSHSTQYDVYVLAEDDETPNEQATLTKIDFQTNTAPVFVEANAVDNDSLYIKFDQDIEFVVSSADFLSKVSATGLDLTGGSTVAVCSTQYVKIKLDPVDAIPSNYSATDLAIQASAVQKFGTSDENILIENKTIGDLIAPEFLSIEILDPPTPTKNNNIVRLHFSEPIWFTEGGGNKPELLHNGDDMEASIGGDPRAIDKLTSIPSGSAVDNFTININGNAVLGGQEIIVNLFTSADAIQDVVNNALGGLPSSKSDSYVDNTAPQPTLASATADNVINIQEHADGFNILAHSTEKSYLYIVRETSGPFPDSTSLGNEAQYTIDPVITTTFDPALDTILEVPASPSWIKHDSVFILYALDVSNNVSLPDDTLKFTADLVAPVVTSSNVTIDTLIGPGGTNSELIIGDQIKAIWDNSAEDPATNGDVESVNFDFVEFGGGIVAGTHEGSDVWAATYTLVAGSNDTLKANVIVHPIDTVGNIGTGKSDQSINVDNELPVVTQVHLNITTTPTGGFLVPNTMFIEGNLVKAVWNSSITGDDNVDIDSVIFDFTDFGGGEIIIRIDDGAGNWIADYIIDLVTPTDRSDAKVRITVYDNSGQITGPVDDNEKYNVDNIYPEVTAEYVTINVGSGTVDGVGNQTFKIDDDVEVTWDNTNGGDDNPDIVDIKVNFKEFLFASNIDTLVNAPETGTPEEYKAIFTVLDGDIETQNDRNVYIQVTDSAGNITMIEDTTAIDKRSLDNIRPVIDTIYADAKARIAGRILLVDSTVLFTLEPVKDEPNATISGAYNAQGLTWSDITAGIGTTFTATYTVVDGELDHKITPLQIGGVVLTDSVGNVSVAKSGSDIENFIDANRPRIQSISIPDVQMIVGNVVTATIVADHDSTDFPLLTGGSIAGKTEASSLPFYNLQHFATGTDTEYTVQFEIPDNGDDFLAAEDIPIYSLELTDTSGNQSILLGGFNTSIIQGSDPIYANLPDIGNVIAQKNLTSIGKAVCVYDTVVVQGNNFLPNGDANVTVTVGGFTIDPSDTSFVLADDRIRFRIPTSLLTFESGVLQIVTTAGQRETVAPDTININPLPKATPIIQDIIDTVDFCLDSYFTVYGSIDGGGDPLSPPEKYVWVTDEFFPDDIKVGNSLQIGSEAKYTLAIKDTITSCYTDYVERDTIFADEIIPPNVYATAVERSVCLSVSNPTVDLTGSYVINGEKGNTGLWTGGTGTFDFDSIFNYTNGTTVIYTPTYEDANRDSIFLQLTSDVNTPCPAVSSEVKITFDIAAVASIIDYPTLICKEDTIELSGVFASTDAGQWLWVQQDPSDYSGDFIGSLGLDSAEYRIENTNLVDLDIKYVLSQADIDRTFVEFKLIPDLGTCGDTTESDNVIVRIQKPPVTGTINGSVGVCANSIGEIYNIGSTGEGFMYEWYIPDSTGTQVSGENSKIISVDWKAITGWTNIRALAFSNIGCWGDTSSTDVYIYPNPEILFLKPSENEGWLTNFDVNQDPYRLDTLVTVDGIQLFNPSTGQQHPDVNYVISGTGITTDGAGIYYFDPQIAGEGSYYITVSAEYKYGSKCRKDSIELFNVRLGVFDNLTESQYCTNLFDSLVINPNAFFAADAADLWLYSPAKRYFIGIPPGYYYAYTDSTVSTYSNPIQSVGGGNYIFDPRIIEPDDYYLFIMKDYGQTGDPYTYSYAEYTFIRIVDPVPEIPTLPDDGRWTCKDVPLFELQDPLNTEYVTDTIRGEGVDPIIQPWAFVPRDIVLNTGVDTRIITLEYFYTDANGCFGETTFDIEVRRTPDLPATDTLIEYCTGDEIQALVATPYPNAFISWYQDPALTNLLEVAPTYLPPIDNTDAGKTYSYYARQELNLCRGQAEEVIVNMNLSPDPSISSLNDFYCDDALDVSFIVQDLTPVGINDSSTILIDEVVFENPILKPQNYVPGEYIVKYSVLNELNCYREISDTVEIKPLPDVSVTGLNALGYCEEYLDDATPVTEDLFGSPVSDDVSTFAAYTVFTTGGSQILPAPVDPGTSSSQVKFKPEDLNAGNYNVIYTYTDEFGCINHDTTFVPISQLPDPTITNLQQRFCNDNADTLLIGSPVADGTSTFGAFLFEGDTLADDIFVPSSTTPSIYTIRYRYQDENGCLNYVDQNLEILAIPVVFISGLSDEYCDDAPRVTIGGNNVADGTSTFEYFMVDGDTLIGDDSDKFIPLNYPPGNYGVTYAYIDDEGCSNDTTETVIINPLPQVALLNLDLGYCNDAGDVALRGNKELEADGVTKIEEFSIIDFAETKSREILPDGVLDISDHTPGTWVVRYKYTDEKGCINYVDNNTQVYQIPKVKFVSDSRCGADTIGFFGATPDFPESEVTNWNWTFYDKGGQLESGKDVKFKFSSTGSFDVTLEIEIYNVEINNDTTICANDSTGAITIGILPEPLYSWNTTCDGDISNFAGVSASLPLEELDSIRWDFNDNLVTQYVIGSTSDLSTFHTFSQPGEYLVAMTMITKKYCIQTVTNRIVISPTYTVNAIPYYADFENSASGWIHDSRVTNLLNEELEDQDQYPYPYNSWKISESFGTIIDPDHVNGKHWITINDNPDPNGTYLNYERSWVVSPCYNFSSTEKPMISMDIWSDNEFRSDGAVLQVSTNSGNTWSNVGAGGLGVDWFDVGGISGMSALAGYDLGNDNTEGWSGYGQDYTEWINARYNLDELVGETNVRFRVLFGSSPDNAIPLDRTAAFEGFAFDNVFIGERNRISLIEQFANSNVTGNNDEETVLDDLADIDQEVITLKYITPFPEDDEFALERYADANARVLFYNVSAAHTSILDGQYQYSGFKSGDEPGDEEMERRFLKLSPFELDLDENNLISSEGILEFDLTVKSLIGYDGPIKIFVAVLEKESTFEDSTKANIVRKLLPDGTGLDEDKAWGAGETETYTFKWIPENFTVLDKDNLSVIAFIQADGNALDSAFQKGEVLQSILAIPGGSNEITPATGLDDELLDGLGINLYPNPVDGNTVYLQFSEELITDMEFKLVDQRGVTLDNGILPAGRKSFEFDTSWLKNGMNYLMLGNEDVGYVVKKLIVLR